MQKGEMKKNHDNECRIYFNSPIVQSMRIGSHIPLSIHAMNVFPPTFSNPYLQVYLTFAQMPNPLSISICANGTSGGIPQSATRLNIRRGEVNKTCMGLFSDSCRFYSI